MIKAAITFPITVLDKNIIVISELNQRETIFHTLYMKYESMHNHIQLTVNEMENSIK